jgi:hypothetical protein
VGNINNCDVTPHAFWALAKSLTKRDRSKAPTTIHGSSVPIFLLSEKANVIAEYLENQFTPHYLCEEDHEQWVAAQGLSSSFV